MPPAALTLEMVCREYDARLAELGATTQQLEAQLRQTRDQYHKAQMARAERARAFARLMEGASGAGAGEGTTKKKKRSRQDLEEPSEENEVLERARGRARAAVRNGNDGAVAFVGWAGGTCLGQRLAAGRAHAFDAQHPKALALAARLAPRAVALGRTPRCSACGRAVRHLDPVDPAAWKDSRSPAKPSKRMHGLCAVVLAACSGNKD
jgi:hypothetical protein